ncbi:MAG: glycoside hydrolase family 25 protein [Lachnospiraceae bacterium]|nr:glycoside hydrolase family 25 protein [Lachnospiraceae bacterium]
MIDRDILEYPDDNITTKESTGEIYEEIPEKRPVQKKKRDEAKQNGPEQPSARKRRARRRRITRTVIWTVLILLLTAAVVVDFILYNAYKLQKQQIEQLSAEKESLMETMNSGAYISKEMAEKEIQEAKDNEKDSLKSEVLKMFENGDSVLTILENIYADKIVVPDSSGYYFYDVDENLAKNGLKQECFEYPVFNEETEEYEGELNYTEEGVTVKRGVDVSKFQGKIDWKKVKNDGMEFAFLRCGYRGYETGKLVEDETFEDNIRACNEVGMDVGVYFFTEAVNEKEAGEEADFVIDLLKEYEVTVQMPIVLDVEQSANVEKSRTKDLTSEERTKVVIAFCEKVKDAGYEPMIYGNLKSHMRMTDIYQLEGYAKWFAYYRTPLRYPYKFDIWQYTSTGSVDGIKGDVDINLAFYRE